MLEEVLFEALLLLVLVLPLFSELELLKSPMKKGNGAFHGKSSGAGMVALYASVAIL